jgi:hypothetical protein
MRRSGPVLQEAQEAEIIHNYRMKRGLMDASEFLKDGKVDVEEMEKIKKINYVSGKWRTSACRVRMSRRPCRVAVSSWRAYALCVPGGVRMCAVPTWRAYACRVHVVCVCVPCRPDVLMRAVLPCGVRMRAVCMWRAYACRVSLACECVPCACGVRMRAVLPCGVRMRAVRMCRAYAWRAYVRRILAFM